MIDVPEGSAAGLTYYIVYSEDLWIALPEDRREYCKETWIKLAMASTAEYVVLMLVPDPLFPIGEHETRYVGWQTKLEREGSKPYQMEIYAFFEVSTGIWSKMDEPTRASYLRNMIDMAKNRGADRYRISCGTSVLKQGKL